MSVLSNVLNLIGLVLMTHAVYSAYEFSLVPAATAPAPRTSALDPRITVPTDIVLETLVSVLLLCVGIVLGAPDLKPIQWRVWAGGIEKEKARPLKNLDEGFGGNPYLALEQRVGFLDIREMRKGFAEWVREGKS